MFPIRSFIFDLILVTVMDRSKSNCLERSSWFDYKKRWIEVMT